MTIFEVLLPSFMLICGVCIGMFIESQKHSKEERHAKDLYVHRLRP